jgi:hypothetical protein
MRKVEAKCLPDSLRLADRLTLDITKVKTADTTVQLFPPARFIHHRMVQEADVLDDTESGPTGSPGRVKEKHGDV